MKFLVRKKDDGKRLDIFLSEKIEKLTRSNIKKIIKSNNVKINRKITNSSAFFSLKILIVFNGSPRYLLSLNLFVLI